MNLIGYTKELKNCNKVSGGQGPGVLNFHFGIGASESLNG